MPAFDLQNYISVQERINAFWKDHPDGAIRTRLMSDPNDFDRCRYEAQIFKDNNRGINPDATGYAFELAGSGMANKTSHEENCETSAIGRALANLGYATTQESRPSREEMTKVAADTTQPRQVQTPMPARSQQTATNVTPLDVDASRMKRLHAIAAARGLNHDELHAIAKGRGKDSLKELTGQEMDTFTNWLEKAPPPGLQAAIDRGLSTVETAN